MSQSLLVVSATIYISNAKPGSARCAARRKFSQLITIITYVPQALSQIDQIRIVVDVVDLNSPYHGEENMQEEGTRAI